MQTSSPGELIGTGEAESLKASTAMPRPRHWISPMLTGRVGHGAPNKEQISVPPVMEDN